MEAFLYFCIKILQHEIKSIRPAVMSYLLIIIISLLPPAYDMKQNRSRENILGNFTKYFCLDKVLGLW